MLMALVILKGREPPDIGCQMSPAGGGRRTHAEADANELCGACVSLVLGCLGTRCRCGD